MTVRVSKIHLRLTLAAVLALLLVGCGLDNRGDDEDQGPLGGRSGSGRKNAVSLEAFTEHVHPVIAANCGACHGSSQSPQFAPSKASDSHSTVMANALISQLDPASSRIYIKGGLPHGGCGPCGSAAAAEILAGIQAWKEAVEAVVEEDPEPTPPPLSGNRITIASQNVNLGAGTTPVTMTFSLEPHGIAGASVSLQLSRFGSPTPTDFMVERIKVVAAGTAVQLEDVLLVVNGNVHQQSSAWRSLKTVVGTNRSATVTTDAMILGVGTLTTLGLSVAKVNAAANKACKAPGMFTAVQTMIQNKCITCHQAGGQGAGAMNVSTGACENFLERGVPGSFTKSAPIAVPSLRLYNHPQTTINAQDTLAISNWYAAEQ